MQFSLRTLLIVLLIAPPVIAIIAPYSVLRAIAISTFAIALIFAVARD